MVTRPILQALVLADQVYTDRHTGKKIIAGTFNRLLATTFPAEFGRPTWAFICLTNLRGQVGIQLRYVDLRTNEVLRETSPITVQSEDPLASLELVVEVPPLPMPHEGVFAFEVHADQERVGALRIQVSKRQAEGGAQ